MRGAAPILVGLLLLTSLAGCTTGEGDAEKSENPEFSATFDDHPAWTYDSVVTVFSVDIKNVQPLKEGERVPEGGTHQVCLELDGEIPDAQDGRPACELVGLAAGEEDRYFYRLAPLAVGVYNVTIRGAETVLEVRPTPALGETISGTLTDITVHQAHDVNGSWEWDIEIEWTDEEAARLMQETYDESDDPTRTNWPVIVLFDVGREHTAGQYVYYNGNPTESIVEAEAPTAREPVNVKVYPHHPELDHHQPEGYGYTDPGLFVWCCDKQ